MKIRAPKTVTGWLMVAFPIVFFFWIWSMANLAEALKRILIANGVKGL